MVYYSMTKFEKRDARMGEAYLSVAEREWARAKLKELIERGHDLKSLLHWNSIVKVLSDGEVRTTYEDSL